MPRPAGAAVRDAANDRLPGLRTTEPRKRCSLTFFVRADTLLLLGLEFLRGLPDPFSPSSTVTHEVGTTRIGGIVFRRR